MKGKKIFIATAMFLTSTISVTAFADEMAFAESDLGGGGDTDGIR